MASINEEGSETSYAFSTLEINLEGHHESQEGDGSWSLSFLHSGLDLDAGSQPQLPLGSCPA